MDFWGTDKINLPLQKSEHHSNTAKRAWADLMFVGSLKKKWENPESEVLPQIPVGTRGWATDLESTKPERGLPAEICLLVDGDFGIRTRSAERAFLRLSTNWRRRSIYGAFHVM